MEKIIILCLAWVLEHFAGGIPVKAKQYKNRLHGYLNIYLFWVVKIAEKFNILHPICILFGLLVPILLLVLLVTQLSISLFGTVGWIVISLGILFLCLGNSINQDKRSVLISAHEQSFGIIFWFMLLGPIGAIFYWLLITLCNTDDIDTNNYDKVLAEASRLHALAGWLPARITGLLYALVGDFSKGFYCWQGCMQTMSMQSSQVLFDCGQASMGSLPTTEEVLLVKRAFIAWIALCVLIKLVI